MTTEKPTTPTDLLTAILAALQRIEGLLAARPAAAAAPPATVQPALPGTLPTTLPPYGKAAGKAIATADGADLQYYLRGCQRTLDDPGKAKWHAKERAMMDAIQRELSRREAQAHGAPEPEFVGPAGDEVPF